MAMGCFRRFLLFESTCHDLLSRTRNCWWWNASKIHCFLFYYGLLIPLFFVHAVSELWRSLIDMLNRSSFGSEIFICDHVKIFGNSSTYLVYKGVSFNIKLMITLLNMCAVVLLFARNRPHLWCLICRILARHWCITSSPAVSSNMSIPDAMNHYESDTFIVFVQICHEFKWITILICQQRIEINDDHYLEFVAGSISCLMKYPISESSIHQIQRET